MTAEQQEIQRLQAKVQNLAMSLAELLTAATIIAEHFNINIEEELKKYPDSPFAKAFALLTAVQERKH